MNKPSEPAAVLEVAAGSSGVEGDHKPSRSLGLFDSNHDCGRGMIGSGIFIVAGKMAREVGSSGWLLLAWIVAGVLTLAAALSYGELAAMMPHVGGQFDFLHLNDCGVFCLRRIRPYVERPYRAFGYPVIPAAYLLCACIILTALFTYRRATTIPGLLIVLMGLPVYFGFQVLFTAAKRVKSEKSASVS